ncbi:MAG: DUF4446 family protein [Anaerolineales bacterium]|nr:DUF4446 family protein [Anaerolineales bacterium]
MEIGLLIWSVALTVLVTVGVVWVLDLQAQLRQMKERQEKKLVSGEGDATLGGIVENLAERLAETTARTERLMAHSAETDALLTRTVQGVGLVRFKAFQDTGGDQSFSLALTDGEGNGVVLSALYGRGATRLYAKPLEGWLSPKPLGEEEEQALAQARESIVGRVDKR